MLGQMISPGAYAKNLMRDDLAPILPNLAELLTTRHATEFRDYGLIVDADVNETERLALCLQWIIDSKLAVVPVYIVTQVSEIAARVLDYPVLAQHAVAISQGNRRRGKGADDRIRPDERQNAVDVALRKRGSVDRDVVVTDLMQSLNVRRAQASKVLAAAGWGDSQGRPKKTRQSGK